MVTATIAFFVERKRSPVIFRRSSVGRQRIQKIGKEKKEKRSGAVEKCVNQATPLSNCSSPQSILKILGKLNCLSLNPLEEKLLEVLEIYVN